MSISVLFESAGHHSGSFDVSWHKMHFVQSIGDDDSDVEGVSGRCLGSKILKDLAIVGILITTPPPQLLQLTTACTVIWRYWSERRKWRMNEWMNACDIHRLTGRTLTVMHGTITTLQFHMFVTILSCSSHFEFGSHFEFESHLG